MKNGLFVGLVTLDFVYLVEKCPNSNQKIVASDHTIAAGGPATNAAVAFSHLGNHGTVMGAVGQHPMTQPIRSDLARFGVTIADLQPDRRDPPTVSSIIVTQSTGERAVVSMNATKFQATQRPLKPLQNVDIVLLDGHQMAVSEAIAQLAKSERIPVVVDGGSWKPEFDRVLPKADYVICSANFYPPNCHDREAVFAYLDHLGISQIAITQGDQPIQCLSEGRYFEIEIPSIQAVDTLGAGDIFHGAFCHYILYQEFEEAIASSARLASHSCQFFGTRQWMDKIVSG